jgi:PhoPQ-activated pathogenicity-related protein
MSNRASVFGFLSSAPRLFVLAASLAVGLPHAGGGEAKPAGGAVPTALADYVGRPDPAFAWKIERTIQRAQGRVLQIELTSQKWQEIVWKHALNLHEPKELKYPRHVLLFITGGSTDRKPGEDSLKLGLLLAQLTGARVAILHQVPNQPLLGGRKEDDLISETWLRFLETGDKDWPLLFPMVKSAVRAMDALQAVLKAQENGPVDGFVVTGGSKRGWTSWLSAAADKRVVAVAPMVIDVLNFRAQTKYQLETWGAYSEQIADYTKKDLIKEGPETARETELRRMMDPYTYRSVLTVPKLLIHGTNDRYWTVDATRWYWDDLVGPKHVLKLPNAGHGLDPGREKALYTLAAFFRHAASGTPLPRLSWTHADTAAEYTLEVSASPKPRSAWLWLARSDTKDFRDSKWRSEPLEANGDGFLGKVPKPAAGHVALFGELRFNLEGLPYSLTTLVRRE